MMRRLAIIHGCLVLSGNSSAHAQTSAGPSEVAAFSALLYTPVGALPQLVTSQRFAEASSGEVAVRYGHYSITPGGVSARSFDNVGVTGDVRLSRRIKAGGTAGYRSCGGCEGLRMGSIDLAASVWHRPGTEGGGDTDLELLVSAGAGRATTSDVTARSLAFTLPLSVALPQPDSSAVAIFIAPSLAYGSLTQAGVSDGTSRFMFAAGIAYLHPRGLGLHATVHRISIDQSPTQLGLAVSWRFGHANGY